MSNKSNGTKFENDFAEYLAKQGYWVAPFPGKSGSNSQPADLIACKNNSVTLIDCKVLSNKSGLFPIERVEQNQIMAYRRWVECGNKDYFLIILWDNTVYKYHLGDIVFDKNFEYLKSIDLKQCTPYIKKFYSDDLFNIEQFAETNGITLETALKYIMTIPDKVIPNSKKGLAELYIDGFFKEVYINENQRQYILKRMKENG